MDSPVLFFCGQGAIAAGVYLLAKFMPWMAAVGVWLLVEGVVTVVWALLSAHRDADAQPWHGGAADHEP